MRTRQFARVEKIRSKERNLLEVLRRQVTQQTLDLFPPSVHPGTPLQYNAPIGGTSVTIYAPLVVLAQAPTRTYVVDTAPSPDPTGGFAPVTIPASNALCELDTDTIVNFAGQPAGEYTVYAAHQIAQEHPETRHPPTIYAEGAGVNSAHRDFFGHSEADNTPIPREAYDPTLTPETISEWVDRVAIAITTGTVGPHARLLIVNWNGSVITQVREPTNLYADMRAALARVTAAENTLGAHIGSRGSAHGLATTSQAGFMSVADKTKLDSAPSDVSAALAGKANLDSSGLIPIAELPRAASGFLAARGTGTAPHYREITAADAGALGLVPVFGALQTRLLRQFQPWVLPPGIYVMWTDAPFVSYGIPGDNFAAAAAPIAVRYEAGHESYPFWGGVLISTQDLRPTLQANAAIGDAQLYYRLLTG